MPKRGGLGQRGLDLLISASPGSTDSSDTEKSTSAAGKAITWLVGCFQLY